MADPFADQRLSLESPYVRGRELLPEDGEFEPTRAIWFNCEGSLTCILADDIEPIQICVGSNEESLKRLRVKQVISFDRGGDLFVGETPALIGLW